jgi:hypothetical protein
MKVFHLLIPILFLFIIGCSHTYEVSKYYSKKDLYKEFNKSASNKELNIVLRNDSSFNGFKGIINDDTLLLNYNSPIKKYLLISNINKVSYKNHWKGIVPGFLLGIISGSAIGSTGWIWRPKDGGNNPHFDQFMATIGGALWGAIIGSVLGYIIGYKYYFHFNP